MLDYVLKGHCVRRVYDGTLWSVSDIFIQYGKTYILIDKIDDVDFQILEYDFLRKNFK